MSPHRPRATRSRTGALLLALALPGAALSACGDEPRAEPTSYLLTDLEGGTAAPGTEPIPVTPSTTPSVRPSRTPSPTRTPEPTRSPRPPSPGIDGSALVALVAAAVGRFETFRVTIGDEAPPPDIEAAVVYGATDAYDATLLVLPGQPQVVFRRVQGTFYAGTADELEAVDPDDPRLASAAGGVVPAFLAWEPLVDLRAAILEAEDVSVSGSTYDYTLDLAALPRPSLLVPDEVTGTAQVELTLDADDLPARLRLTYPAGGADTVVSVDYSAWGQRVQIEVPPAG